MLEGIDLLTLSKDSWITISHTCQRDAKEKDEDLPMISHVLEIDTNKEWMVDS